MSARERRDSASPFARRLQADQCAGRNAKQTQTEKRSEFNAGLHGRADRTIRETRFAKQTQTENDNEFNVGRSFAGFTSRTRGPAR
jgi:hypothetical protein